MTTFTVTSTGTNYCEIPTGYIEDISFAAFVSKHILEKVDETHYRAEWGNGEGYDEFEIEFHAPQLTGFWYSDNDSFFGEPQFVTDIEQAYQNEIYSYEDSPEYVPLAEYASVWQWVPASAAGMYLHEIGYCYDDEIAELIRNAK